MGVAHFSLEVSFESSESMDALFGFSIASLAKSIIRIDSLDCYIPSMGTDAPEWHCKENSSIDGATVWGDHWNLPRFATEKFNSPVPGYSSLDKSADCINERDISLAIKSLADEASRVGNVERRPRPRVDFWGRTKVTYAASENDALSVLWPLREFLAKSGNWQPLLHVSCQYIRERSEINVLIGSVSHSWSHYLSVLDPQGKHWIPKTDLRSANSNAVLLADAIKDLRDSCQCTQFSWNILSEGTPNLVGTVKQELALRIGSPSF